MNSEFAILTAAEQAVVRRVISLVRANPAAGQQSETLPDGGDVYAYPRSDGVHWGINDAKNHGWCSARGVWPEDEPA